MIQPLVPNRVAHGGGLSDGEAVGSEDSSLAVWGVGVAFLDDPGPGSAAGGIVGEAGDVVLAVAVEVEEFFAVGGVEGGEGDGFVDVLAVGVEAFERLGFVLGEDLAHPRVVRHADERGLDAGALAGAGDGFGDPAAHRVVGVAAEQVACGVTNFFEAVVEVPGVGVASRVERAVAFAVVGNRSGLCLTSFVHYANPFNSPDGPPAER